MPCQAVSRIIKSQKCRSCSRVITAVDERSYEVSVESSGIPALTLGCILSVTYVERLNCSLHLIYFLSGHVVAYDTGLTNVNNHCF